MATPDAFASPRVRASTEGTVELTLEGLPQRADVLMARLSAGS